MNLFYFLYFLLPLSAHSRDELRPSYQSSVVEDGRPILRGGEQSEPEDVKTILVLGDNRKNINQKHLKEGRDPALVRDLKLFLNWLRDSYGYEIAPTRRQGTSAELDTAELRSKHERKKRDAGFQDRRSAMKKPYYSHRLRKHFRKGVKLRDAMYSARRNVIDIIKHNNIEWNKSKNEDGKDLESKNSTKRSLDSDELGTYEPEWKTGFKEFMRDLIRRVPGSSIDQYTIPVIKAIEANNKVHIADIDVDKFGHIFIDYVDMTKPKSKIIIDKAKLAFDPVTNGFTDKTYKRKTKRKNKKKHGPPIIRNKDYEDEWK